MICSAVVVTDELLFIIIIYIISGIKAILQDSSMKIADDEGVSPSSSVITNHTFKMDSAISELPENILNAAGEALNSLIPEKSQERYDKAYNAFKQWQSENHTMVIEENDLLAYFQELVSYSKC
jgi:hypothetical protein